MKLRYLVAIFIVLALAAPVVSAQEIQAETQVYRGGLRPSYKDVYCAGFVSSTRIEPTLTIIAGEEAIGRIIYAQEDYVYISRGGNGGVQVGQEYLVVRLAGDPTRVKSFKEQDSILSNIGHLYQDVGRVRIHVTHETTATAHIVHVCDAMQNGDILIPLQERPVPDYKAGATYDRFAPFSGGPLAMVVAARDFPALVGTGDTIYINLGTNQNVKVGDYFRIFRYGTGTKYEGAKRGAMGATRGYKGQGVNFDPTSRKDVPREALGEAMVVWVDKDSSTAIITFTVSEVHPGDYVELQPPAPPTASLTIEPRTITRGQSAVLSWSTGNATEREVAPGIGSVDREGTRRVSPNQTTTYRISATGPGGSTEAQATLAVVEPPPPPPPPSPRAAEQEPGPAPAPTAPSGPSLDELFAQNVQDIFFAFNSSHITPEARAMLERAAQFLNAYPEVRVLTGGHADEIGSPEYNRQLGLHRGNAARDVLVSLGVDPSRISVISHGEDSPFCTQSSEEACRKLNRRAHFLRQ